MTYAAVFVDAGYLYAQGGVALTGAQQPRSSLQLDEASVALRLEHAAARLSSDARLLRIYWYDAALKSGVTAQQAALGATDNIKLRLGVLNGLGQQKGVDSLIVTDLIELSRNRAISDAVLLCGDEDVRIGVQIAQNYGVRVHLLGIHPARGSQSALLRQEADTTTEWMAADLDGLLSVREPPAAAPASPVEPSAREEDADPELPDPQAEIVAAAVAALTPDKIGDLAAYWSLRTGLPPEEDRPLLARCRDALDRTLTPDERLAVRQAFTRRVRARPDFPVGG